MVGRADGAVQRVLERIRGARGRRGLMLALDSLIWAVAVPAGTSIRYELDWAVAPLGVALVALLAVALNLAGGWHFGLYRGRWRVGSIDECVGIGALVTTVTAALVVVSATTGRPIPIGGALMAGALALLALASTRVLYRLLSESFDDSIASRRMLVFGAGEAAAQVIAGLLADQRRQFRPVALLDDDPRKARRTIRGIQVEGSRASLLESAQRHDADVLLIAAPGADSATIRELTALARGAGLDVLVLPPAAEMYGTFAVSDIRQVTEEDLLGRHPVKTDLELVAGYIAGRTVLITGAGGSIGSELCRQVHALQPAQLVMVDRDESALHGVQLSLTGRAMLDSDELVVADIRDADRMIDVFERWRPDVVFHAAALKHLPLLEMHAAEGVKTNVVGTLNVLQAAAAAGVSRFVNISTDKAADPTSVLGYTKRIAERLTAFYGASNTGTFLSVRFGNVLGSRGSVLTAFRSQIENGGPVTVTHEDVTRYFMTVEEAVQLVIQAGAVGSDGEALVLDMGNPVRIRDVAERMISVAERPLEIVYTGLRPGEKLHEILLGDEEADVRPAHPLISHTPVPALDPLELHVLLDDAMDDLDVMISLCANRARRWTPQLWEAEADPHLVDVTDAAVPPVRISLSGAALREDDLRALGAAFNGPPSTPGDRVSRFERAFAEHHQIEHVVAVANEAFALHAMLRSLRLRSGDEVIVPSLCAPSVVQAVRQTGATTVWADVDRVSHTIDAAHVSELLTERTRAVVADHFGGHPAPVDVLAELCHSRGVHLIEDASEAPGCRFHGRAVASFGTLALFAMGPRSRMVAEEGAVVATNDDDVARELRSLRDVSATFGHSPLPAQAWHLSEMSAALGLARLSRLDDLISKTRSNAAWMSDRLGGISGLEPPVVMDDVHHTFSRYLIRAERCRERYLSCLMSAGIEARLAVQPAHLGAEIGRGQLPVTAAAIEQLFVIPIHADLTSEELEQIAGVLERVSDQLSVRPPARVLS